MAKKKDEPDFEFVPETDEGPASPEPVFGAPLPDTLNEVLARLNKRPRKVMFQSIRAAGQAICIGNDVFKFKDHDLITDNPADIEKLMRCERYGLDYFTLDNDLRKAER